MQLHTCRETKRDDEKNSSEDVQGKAVKDPGATSGNGG